MHHRSQYRLPFEQKLVDNSSVEDLPRYEFVTSIYQVFGLSLIAVLSQDVPRVRIFPAAAQAEEDVAAAKAATEVSQLVERNNRIGKLIVDEAFHLWTGGEVGAYVRYVVDGQRFGFHPEREISARTVKLGNDVYVCPECGEETEAGKQGGEKADETEESAISDWQDGLYSRSAPTGPKQRTRESAPPSRDDSGGGGKWVNCSARGALLTEENFVAVETITVPMTQTR